MDSLTFANYKEYSINLPIDSLYMMCQEPMSSFMYEVYMSNSVSQCLFCLNLPGLLEPNLRSKEALQTQVRMISLLVLGPLVWSIVSKCDKCLNSKCQLHRSLAILYLRTACRMYIALFMTVYRQPPLSYIYPDLSGHD